MCAVLSSAEGAVSPDSTLPLGLKLLDWMIRTRALEERLRRMYMQGQIRGRLLSGRGQEAISVAATASLRNFDVVAPVHRDLGAHLVRGTSALDVLRHYLGRTTGLSQGRDGDIHMGDWRRGVFPMVSHLPDSWPVMVGVGLAFKLRREARVTLAFCGDGATSTGTWHESLNFAAVMRTPTVFVVENNRYAYSTPARRQYRVEHIADRASAYGIPGQRVDGNDALAVFTVCSEAVQRARLGGGPTLVEADTFRIEGHAIHDDASYVGEAERREWEARDPIDGLCERLEVLGAVRSTFDEMGARAASEIEDALAVALSEPLPDPSTLLEGVYGSEMESGCSFAPAPAWAEASTVHAGQTTTGGIS